MSMLHNKNLKLDWADIVDIFAREYGWTIDEIKKLDIGQVTALIKVIKRRYDTDVDDVEIDVMVSDLKAMGGKEKIRDDGRKEIVL